MTFGIEAASYYVPSLYLEIKNLAEKRGIEPAKLEKGLGLHKMALPDVHEDAATFTAESLLKLIQDYNLDPKEISRVYLGTESALDAAKPTATYAVQMVEEFLTEEFGERVFKHCDVVDMTFACIGAVDALHNALDFVRANPTKKAVVIDSDYAKYELASSGEYTQGGGAVALLVSEEIANSFTETPIYMIGSGQASDGALPERENLYSIPAALEAGRQAYQMANLGPDDIDIAEVHDCFTIAEIIATEDLGFFDRGKGWQAAIEGKTARDGIRPVNTSGGLKAKGHPVGATGVGQVAEIWKQLNGIAGERQVQGNPKIGLTHNVGGTGQTCVVNIFERRA